MIPNHIYSEGFVAKFMALIDTYRAKYAEVAKDNLARSEVVNGEKEKFFCRLCGHEIRPDSIFCERCGKNLA
jgi:hypothetical protein